MSASARRLEHAADDELLDYARGLGDEASGESLLTHLGGCGRCAASLRLWQAVVEVARREAEYAPGDAPVRQAKGVYSLHRPAPERASWVASLVFDSFRQPAPAPVRASGPGPRHLLFKAGRYTVRLRAEHLEDTGRVSLVGQVVDEEVPGSFLPGVPVVAFAGDEAVDRTVTNQLGEFAFETARTDTPLQLAIGLRGETRLKVALPDQGSGDGRPAAKRPSPE